MPPHVTIVIPLMDRAADIERTLPTILCQDYPAFDVLIVDNGSRDAVAAVVGDRGDAPVRLVERARPAYFSFSESRNAGAALAAGELIFFLNGDNYLHDAAGLSRIVGGFLAASEADYRWVANWREHCGYDDLTLPSPAQAPSSRFGTVYSHTLGSVLMVERIVFEQLGGFNEVLEDWGYEDTDLITRLELSGFGRIETPAVAVADWDDRDEEAERVKNFRVQDRDLSWARNRLVSDHMIRRWGPAFSTRITTTPVTAPVTLTENEIVSVRNLAHRLDALGLARLRLSGIRKRSASG